MSSVWAYCRVSTTKQEQEESLDVQEAWAREFAREKGDLAPRLFLEKASAKTTLGRPIFQAMMAELAKTPKARRPAFLAVTALDRLSRDIVDTMNVVRTLGELNVQLYQRGYGLTSMASFPEKAALAGMSLAGEAENYGRMLRAKASWDRRRAEGKPTSNKVPYGLQLRAERDVPSPPASDWVRRAFEWYDAGDGMYKISMRFLANAPEHTWLTNRVGPDGERIRKKRTPTKWEGNRIGKLLRQGRYRGTIVTEELFDRVQKRLANTPKSGNRRKREYPLTAALRCDSCGRRLHGHASGGTSTQRRASGEMRRYSHKRIRYYSCLVCRYSLNAERLETAFFADVGRISADPTLLERWLSAPSTKARDIVRARHELEDLERESSEGQLQRSVDRVFDLGLKLEIGEVELRRQIDRVKEQFARKRIRIEELRKTLDSSEARTRSLEQATRLLKNFKRLYDRSEYETKRELVGSLADALGGARTGPEGLSWAHGAPPRLVDRRTITLA